jgi:hypothetical protein
MKDSGKHGGMYMCGIWFLVCLSHNTMGDYLVGAFLDVSTGLRPWSWASPAFASSVPFYAFQPLSFSHRPSPACIYLYAYIVQNWLSPARLLIFNSNSSKSHLKKNDWI